MNKKRESNRNIYINDFTVLCITLIIVFINFRERKIRMTRNTLKLVKTLIPDDVDPIDWRRAISIRPKTTTKLSIILTISLR